MGRIEQTQQHPDLAMLATRLLFSLQDEIATRLAERGHGAVRPRHAAVLAFLDEAGVRATELARLSGRPAQIVRRFVDELEELGYVERRPDPRDRRAKLVVPTDRGLDVQRQADAIVADIERRHAAALGSAGYADFRRRLLAVTRSRAPAWGGARNGGGRG